MIAWQVWAIVGIILLATELIGIPGFLFGSAGVGALLAALVSLVFPLAVQWLVWFWVTVILIFLSRRCVPQQSFDLEESREARSLTEIPAGKKGRVRYSGSIWNAKCEVEDLTIPAGLDLYVIERQGNTLIVMPEHFVNSQPAGS
ncbi:NfeD family protein [Synechococcus sp. PCC 7336]|uniref:NfeD family protein n=1 Tax=Synechococcus sp. PCC 7336 TaxID=195250 RepID=UPI00034C53E1|nr:NfeD family protein [Synechococcus sp. PCC 7336]